MPFTDDAATAARDTAARIATALVGNDPAVAMTALSIAAGSLIAMTVRPEGVLPALDRFAASTRLFAETALAASAKGVPQ